MLLQHLKLALRNIRYKSLFTLINVLRLAIGITCCTTGRSGNSFFSFPESSDGKSGKKFAKWVGGSKV